jgi:membrane-associated phospholipid phosphatase
VRLVKNLPALVISMLLLFSATPRPARAQEDPAPRYSSFHIPAEKGADSASSSESSAFLSFAKSGRTSARFFPALIEATASKNQPSWLGGQADPAAKSGKPEAPRFRDFGRALGYNFTKGLFSCKNLKPLLIGSAATLAFVPFDQKISDSTRGNFTELGKSGQVIGSPAAIMTLTGGLLVAVPMTKNVRYRSFVFTEMQGLALTNAQVFALKYVIRRTRPDASNQRSFPSAHAANIFAFATVTYHYYGKKIGIPLYIVACLVAASRVEKGIHYPSDVIFGALLGFISGSTAIRGTEHIISVGHKGR